MGTPAGGRAKPAGDWPAEKRKLRLFRPGEEKETFNGRWLTVQRHADGFKAKRLNSLPSYGDYFGLHFSDYLHTNLIGFLFFLYNILQQGHTHLTLTYGTI